MIHLPENHSDELVIGVGAHRACYIHPEDHQKCIKGNQKGISVLQAFEQLFKRLERTD